MRVKEIFYSLQGEGARAGRPAVFVRFAGCNLWSGREVDRATAACRFCDTDFVGGDTLSEQAVVEKVTSTWPAHDCRFARPYVVLTGGEPTLQVTESLVRALRAAGFEVAIETNGTRPVDLSVDWITVSPKVGTGPWVEGNEIKVVVPQDDQHLFIHEHRRYEHFFVQPRDDGDGGLANLPYAVQICLERPQWRLSVQLHKLAGIA